MNIKLLKVCAAIMLIVGAGDVVCQGDEGGSSSVETPQNEWSGWGDNVSVSVTGKIEAIVKVRCGNKEKKLVFFQSNGQKTSESERTFPFQVRCIASNCKVDFKPAGNLRFDGGKWTITNKDGDGVLPLKVKLKKAGKESEELKANTCDMTPEDGVEIGDEETWSIIFDVDNLSAKSPKGEFEGALTLEVSAA